jgi:hypothetical protein
VRRLRLGLRARDRNEIRSCNRNDHCQGNERRGRRSFGVALAAQNSLDPHLQHSAVRAEHKLRERRATLFEEREGTSVGQHIAANRDRKFVAAALALAADLLRDTHHTAGW